MLHRSFCARVRLLACVAALAIVAGCAQNYLEWEDPDPHPLLIGPYVILTGRDGAIVGFRVLTSPDAEVAWKTADGKTGRVRARLNAGIYAATLEGLPRGPVIEYDVILDGKPVTSGKFRVGTAPGETRIRFATFGDTRNGHAVHREIVTALAREEIDFILNTGDYVQNGGRVSEWTTFFQIERPLLAKVPIIPTTGNHDLSGRGYYERFFFVSQVSKGRRYFATDWGNLRLIALDNGIECNRACAQFEYVRRVLADGAAQGKLMVMFLHHAPYSSGEHGSNVGVARAIGELAQRYGVELVIAGHDHHYERTKPIDGTTYIVSGSAGAPIRPVEPSDFTASARTEPHYVLIDVDGERITTRAINLRGEVFDTGVIEQNPARVYKPR
ncbi:MAG: metallophosphoesterase [Deltaproteobacteria bacterium]|nr:metallophosphoesterase [Deltaproteobacteria bacterium]MDQ3301526.1 metallophosphoesterase [Myxococcota bacterium]